MVTENRHSGTLRTGQEANLARVDGFPVITTDAAQILHRLAKEEKLRPLLTDHVLTVLADIRRKRLSGYGETFADAQGTASVTFYAEKLRRDIEGWTERLEEYLKHAFTTGSSDSPAAEVACELRDSLENSLPKDKNIDKHDYYRMLRNVTAIQENIDRYQQQTEENGNTEPTIALLIAYLKNYSGIAETFNRRFTSLTELYLRDILHATPKAAEPDKAYVVITLTAEAQGFTLLQGSTFPAGEELTYRTEQAEDINPVRCTEVYAIHLQQSVLRKSPLLLDSETLTTNSLFPDGQPVYLGWRIESPMLVLGEGKREVSLRFRLTADSVLPDNLPANTIMLQLSNEEGWTEQPCQCHIETLLLQISFTKEPTVATTTACREEVHGTDTIYPALRILTAHPQWANRLQFDNLEIEVKASGIRSFTLCNELSEADPMQAIFPFSIQAEQGSRFFFSNEETAQKPLQEVELKGRWQKLPATRQAFDAFYAPYGVNSDAFTVSTAYLRQGVWHSCPENQRLLDFDDEGNLSDVKVLFRFTEPKRIEAFRVTLVAPSIGFGTAAYRKKFTNVMIHNSRCKEKERKEMPEEMAVPQLIDVELSYIATATIPLEKQARHPSRLSRVTALSEQETFPTHLSNMAGSPRALPFLLPLPTEHLLYFAFTRAEAAKTVRMYIDMALPQSIPFGGPQPDKQIRTSWELWNGSEWQLLPLESIKVEDICGLTQSGFVEIELPGEKQPYYTDRHGRLWLRATLSGDISACLALRSVWTNCIRVTAVNGDGTPLPAETLQELEEIDERIESITQPLPGFGGRIAETDTQCTVKQQMRLHNRHRGVTMKNYEELVLEHFPEVDKAQCIAIPKENASSDICIVVFSRMEDSRYFLSQAWKLEEIRRMVGRYMSPFVPLKVVNPQYEEIDVYCRVVLRDNVQDESKVLRQLVVLAQNCIAPWYRKREMPDSGRSFSYKELHARMANHEYLLRLVLLEVGGVSLPDGGVETEDRVFKGSKPWSILLPKIKIELLSPGDGIEKAKIGGNFIIR